MNTDTFEYLSKLIYRESGIVLAPEKRTLLENRLRKRLRALGVESEADYLGFVANDRSGGELVELIDAISTNVTFFYREPRHFEVYSKLLKQMAEQGAKSIKIWCAAAATGEEPYTLAIETMESLGPKIGLAKLLCTDICVSALERAAAGEYKTKDLEKVPENRRHYFQQIDENTISVDPNVARLPTFKKFNLINFPYPLSGPIDIIFCRNVMIYFDVPTRQKIIDQFQRLLRPGGFLFLSHSENLLGVTNTFKRFDSSVFQKV